MRRYTLAEARYILSHVYCVSCLPDSDGWVYPWGYGFGEPICCRCPCRNVPDLRLYVASVREATEWLEKENTFVDAYNAERMTSVVKGAA